MHRPLAACAALVPRRRRCRSATHIPHVHTPDRDLVIGQSLPEGRYFKTFAANMALEFTEEQHAQLLRDGLRVSRTVAPRAGAHRLHIVVRDAPSGATGSLIIPLQPRR
jgi:hypothetical protein